MALIFSNTNRCYYSGPPGMALVLYNMYLGDIRLEVIPRTELDGTRQSILFDLYANGTNVIYTGSVGSFMPD